MAVSSLGRLWNRHILVMLYMKRAWFPCAGIKLFLFYLLVLSLSFSFNPVSLFEIESQGDDLAVCSFGGKGIRLLAVVSDVFYLITVEGIRDAIHKLELRAQFEVGQIEITS